MIIPKAVFQRLNEKIVNNKSNSSVLTIQGSFYINFGSRRFWL